MKFCMVFLFSSALIIFSAQANSSCAPEPVGPCNDTTTSGFGNYSTEITAVVVGAAIAYAVYRYRNRYKIRFDALATTSDKNSRLEWRGFGNKVSRIRIGTYNKSFNCAPFGRRTC